MCFFIAVKIDQRLTLFYLANDVIQYSKRKSLQFVESWGTALQKATTLVRYVEITAHIKAATSSTVITRLEFVPKHSKYRVEFYDLLGFGPGSSA